MKTTFSKIIAILGLILLGVSCDDSFLDTKPIASAAPETFYTSVESIDLALTTCYSYFKVEKVWDLSIVMTMGSITSDEAEAGAGGKGDVVQFQHVDQLRHSPAEAQIFEHTWGYPFRAIGACNVAIESIPGVITEDEDDVEILDNRLGEAYFLRAFNFFYLTIMFGGVPKVDHVLSPEEFEMTRSTVSEIINLIKSDLRLAIDKLPTKSEWGNSNVGRASKGAAMALLAKTYLYESSYAKNYAGDERFGNCQQHWDSVVYWGDQVINSGEYELIGLDGERFTTWRDAEGTSPATSAYQYIFMMQANNSPEGVYEIQCRNDGLGWFYSRGEALVTWCAPRKVRNAGGSGNYDFGWGWWCPTDFLMNSFEAGDPRMEATIIDSDDTIWTDTYGWVTPNFNDLFDGTGLDKNSHKYECSPEEVLVGPSNWPMGPINLKMIRIADVYLWVAEAYLELGQAANGLPYINAVRTRARLCGAPGNTVPANLAVGEFTHEALELERLYELSMEGHRFWDLVRWRLANQYLDHTLADGDEIEFVEGLHEFFPIPSQEILQSGGALVQYDGWN